jgi:hypothetical protein
MKGWVYIITNKAMPNILKIGYSTKDPEIRANDLHTTGVPYRYVVEYDALVVILLLLLMVLGKRLITQ